MIAGIGNKIQLRNVEPRDLEQLRQWRNQPVLRQYFREYREITPLMQQKWYEDCVCTNKNQVDFVIERPQPDADIIGHCGLYYIDWLHKRAEFTIYIGNMMFRNHGCGSDALRTLCKYGFEELNLNKIWCEVFDNNPAIVVYRHLGFVDEGTLRQHHFSVGRYMDSHILSMLRSEVDKQ